VVSRRNVLLFVLLCAGFGFAFVAIKIGLRYSDPVFLIAIRMWGAGALLVALLIVTRRDPAFPREDLPAVALLGLLNSGLVGLFLFLGQEHLSAGLGSILLYTYPLMAAGAGVAFLGEPLNRARVIGLAAGFAGIVLVAGGALGGSVVGVVYMLSAAATWALATVVFKKALQGRDMVPVAAWSMVVGAAFLQVMSAVLEGVPHVEATKGFWLSFLYLAGPGMALPGALWYYLLNQGEATVASAYLFLTPFFGVLSGWLVLSEHVTWLQAAGGILIAAGIYLVNRTARRDRDQMPRSWAALSNRIR
jgi:drug/metabolite transporter (DMT)-like permease